MGKKNHVPLQSPVEERKNPGAHFAHAVPLFPAIHPGLHVHWPLGWHCPFRQLQLGGALATIGIKQRPDPEMPSSQEEQLLGHGRQFGPKNPCAQVSQDDPVNPGGHEHVPEAEQTPEPEHGGEHAEDWMSVNRSLDVPDGS